MHNGGFSDLVFARGYIFISDIRSILDWKKIYGFINNNTWIWSISERLLSTHAAWISRFSCKFSWKSITVRGFIGDSHLLFRKHDLPSFVSWSTREATNAPCRFCWWWHSQSAGYPDAWWHPLQPQWLKFTNVLVGSIQMNRNIYVEPSFLCGAMQYIHSMAYRGMNFPFAISVTALLHKRN
jgi:hypothetical protein